jgi:hypothetical protein
VRADHLPGKIERPNANGAHEQRKHLPPLEVDIGHAERRRQGLGGIDVSRCLVAEPSERAQVRASQLVLTRDRANLDQALHAAAHSLAASYRNLDQQYEQYLAFARVRDAARTNVEQQLARQRLGFQDVLLLDVLTAITAWGNAVSDENQALVLYNTELANLERETGTILESHGVRFWEERFRAVGPLGRHFPPVCYPRSMPPGPNVNFPPVPPEDAYRLPEVVPLPDIGSEEVSPPPERQRSGARLRWPTVTR